ncbi:MAG TPA: AAA family ATPase [Pseudobdellovibrionaceae bacterium]|jgi:predicted AAA+ superfamily ATPase
MVSRILTLEKIISRKSLFLFGPRMTGKTTYLKKNIVIIDEIQKMPELLNEIHKIIEEKKQTRFILTGSSARKLKKVGINLLGGRASEIHMKPLTLFELKEQGFQWTDALSTGLLPSIITSPEPELDLKDYVHLYLQREIKEEALVKNFLNFSRFIDFVNCQPLKAITIKSKLISIFGVLKLNLKLILSWLLIKKSMP